ncbi:MAG: Transcriptional regulator, AcrR family [Pseudolabrys sp.]|jgi:AcrR family transcriptional regulator|nr:Transcriptional regulator, AcrR family [Pseudolabrys sp.]
MAKAKRSRPDVKVRRDVKAGRRTEAGDVRRAERRDAILSAALDEFSSQGFAAARLDDVARRAGVAKGTIYLYFRDKDTLFQELIRSMLTPVVGSLEQLRDADVPICVLGDQLVEFFVRDIFNTRRRDVIRLMIAEGRRFPKLAEFYYREVLSRILSAMRALLSRAVARGELPDIVLQYPQLLAAPGLIAVIWTGLFDKYEPIDVRAMMKANLDILLSAGRRS